MLIRTFIFILAVLLPAADAFAQMASAEGEAASNGFFRDQDTLPGSYQLYLQQPKELDWLWALGPEKKKPRRASFMKDSHSEVRDYSPRTRCTDCHREKTKDLHQIRMGISCVQCHRDEPIAGVYHYYSAMNPIRRHAYVCAKCHEGATPSFASYVVHEPNPLSLETQKDFPLLFYGVWLMLILAVGVFVFFLPYVGLWSLRELIGKFSKGGRHD